MMKMTTFVWDLVSDCVISELDDTNVVQAVYTSEPQHYGAVISQRCGSTSHVLHADALGTTRLLTTSAGASSDTYLYDAWGNLITSSGTTVNPFRWVGRYGYYMDQSTGMVYVRARMYLSTVARWASVDPVGLPGSYEYSINVPSNWIDPSGHYCVALPDNDCAQFVGPFAYGCHCGESKFNLTDGEPIDAIDTACLNHDRCWGKINPPCEAPKVKLFPKLNSTPDSDRRCRKCDQALCDSIKDLKCAEYADDEAKLSICQAFACYAMFVFQCGQFHDPKKGPEWPFGQAGLPTCIPLTGKWPPSGPPSPNSR